MITPELEALRTLIRERRPGGELPDIATRRRQMDEFATAFPIPDGVATEDVEIAGRPARWYRPEGGDADRVVLYLHGGAYVSGSLDSHREPSARLSLACGTNVLALDYRLAPEHPLPAAIEDASAAWAWLIDDGGCRPDRAAIAGDSAGGGLTMATLIALRDAGGALPAAVALLSPWVDVACRQASYTERAELEPMLHLEFLRADAARYVGDADILDLRANPIDADLSGLPPILVLVGTDEILYDDSVVLHERLVAAGVDAELVVGEDMFHVWPAFPMLPEAHDAMRTIAAFVSKHTT